MAVMPKISSILIALSIATGCVTHPATDSTEQSVWNPETAKRQALDMLGLSSLSLEEGDDYCTMGPCYVSCCVEYGSCCYAFCDGYSNCF